MFVLVPCIISTLINTIVLHHIIEYLLLIIIGPVSCADNTGSITNNAVIMSLYTYTSNGTN